MARSSQTQGFGKPKPAVTKNAWRAINWAKVQRMVFKLQKRIYQAAQSGTVVKARRLQRLLFKSYYARLLAVRRVTQDNQGKKTAGEEQFPKKGSKNQAVVVRYADDFVVISPKLEVIEQCQIVISEWLEPIGLQLKPEKTRICHTLQEIEVNGKKVAPGFDFLGFNIRQYPVGKHRSGKSGGRTSKLLGFKTHIKPDKEAIKAHIEKVKEVIKKHKTAPQAALIKQLNPIITGWTKYYSGGVSTEIFNKLDNILWQQLRAWVVSRCGNAEYKTLRKYFHSGKVILSNGRERNEKWIFQTQDGLRLQKHNWTPNIKHKLVRPDASTYDGNWVYWATRRGKSPDIPNREAKLLKDQKGKCKWCGQHFTIEDQLEIDHITPRSLGGKDDYKNLQLLHRHCHDQKTAIDGSMSRTHDNETTELGAV